MAAERDMTRRTFLRTGALAGGFLLTGPAAPLGATARTPEPEPAVQVYPLTVQCGPRTIAIEQQFPFAPLAYFSKGENTLFVDRRHRDRIAHLLGAHIDARGRWIFAGAARPTRVRDLSARNRRQKPREGDGRLVPRAPITAQWHFRRLPVFDADSPTWLDGAPLQHRQCLGSTAAWGWEQYALVGTCGAYADPDCIHLTAQVLLFNWAAGAHAQPERRPTT